MSEKMVTPYFLTDAIAKEAVSYVLDLIKCFHDLGKIRRQMCHIVILVPSMKDDKKSDYSDYPDYPIKPHILLEHSIGDPQQWPHKFDSIARCKALQLWHGRNEGCTDCMPHLLFPGDTPYWGGVKRDGIVVACSGFQPHFDRMFAGIVADLCIGIAYNVWAGTLSSFTEDFLP